MKKILSLFTVLLSTVIFAQTNVSGTVTDENNSPIPGANIVVDQTTGAVSNFDGEFSLKVSQNPPFDIRVSSVGFETKTITITESNLSVDVILNESQNLLDEVVLSASRVPERLFESPVTVERFDYKDIVESTGSSFYTSLDNIKGVQINRGAMLLPIVNTRGFSTLDNTGFVQLVDGMDNAAPGLNFSAGNLVGINEIDIQSVELLPGAASALYGANAIKGILLMNSKSPFDFPGFSAYVRTGVTSQDASGDNMFYDVAVRMAHKFSDKFALKAVLSVVDATDWLAADFRDKNHLDGRYIPGTPNLGDVTQFPDYDGINMYGEAGLNFNLTNVFLGSVVPSFVASGQVSPALANNVIATFQAVAPDYFGSQLIRSTGYKESDLVDGGTTSVKFDIAAHYRIDSNKELIWNSKIGNGSTLYHATNRNALKNFQLQQHKIEYRTPKLTARAYTTIEDSGNFSDLTALGLRIANAQPGGLQGGWFPTYLNTFYNEAFGLVNANPLAALSVVLGGLQQGITSFDALLAARGVAGGTLPAHMAARKAADQNMLKPGSAAFREAYLQQTTTTIADGGANVADQSKANSVEFNYNLGDLIPAFDLTVGGSYRNYILRSGGSLFTDYVDPIEFDEVGLYTQVQKDYFDGVLKLTASMRYDKSKYLEGNFTPRIGALVNVTPRSNIRASYQTGFRNPSSQDLYIGLDVQTVVIIGTSPDSVARFNMPLVGSGSLTPYNVTGDMVQNNSYTLGILNGDTTKADLKNVEPEFVKTKEFGYRYNGTKFAVDLSAYWSEFTNFITEVQVVTPFYGSVSDLSGAAAVAAGDFRAFSWNTNTDDKVTTKGFSLGVDAKVGKFNLGTNVNYNELNAENADPDFVSYFNTPPVRVKLQLGSTELSENFSFNLSARYHNEFLWEGTFGSGMIPENWTFDASVNVNVPELKGSIKLGAINLSGKDYLPYFGGGMIGSTYYVKYTINP